MASQLPPFDQPGFDLHATRQPRLLGTYITLIVVTTIFITLRLLSRRVSGAGLWWDDLLAVLAWLASILVPITGLVTIRIAGYGKHIWVATENPQLATERFLQSLFAAEICWTFATCIVKFSILAFYRRIFPIKQLGTTCLTLGAVVASMLVACITTIGLQCRPLSSFWHPSPTAKCIDLNRFFIAAGSINAVLDFIILALPIPLLWRLKTSGLQKSTLTGIFTMAGFVCIVSIIRIVVLSELINADLTWNWVDEGIWTSVEPTMGVVSACLPSLRPLFSALWRGSYRATSIDHQKNSFSSNTRGHPIGFHARLGSSGDAGRRWSGSEEPINMESGTWGAHNVDCRAGDGKSEGELEEVELPKGGIRVKTEITLLSSERVEYRDQLF